MCAAPIGTPVAANASQVSTQIIGGSVADHTQTGWFVQLELVFKGLDGTGDLELSCGGVALTKLRVLTAAHCSEGSAQGAGRMLPSESFAIHNPSRNLLGKRYAVRRVHTHPDWNPRTFHNDLAVLDLAEPLPLKAADRVVINSDATIPSAGGPLQVYGFGVNAYGIPSTKLQFADILNLDDGSGQCGKYESREYFKEGMICGGVETGEVDSCQGDSGGPLLADVEDRRLLVGLVSSGNGCALPDYPGLYTRLSTYQNWIARAAPNAYFSGPRARLSIIKSCSTCKLYAGKPLEFTLRNSGDLRGNFTLASEDNRVRIQPSQGTLEPGQLMTVSITTRSKKSFTSLLSLRMKVTELIKLSVNPPAKKD